MPTEKIKCSACGFGALLFTTGESTKIIVDSAKQIQICNRLKHQPKSNTGRVGPLDCRNFLDAVHGPATHDDSGSSALDDQAQSEAIEAKEVAPEKPADEIFARPRKSGRAKVSETSPKAKSPRLSSRKIAGRRSAEPGSAIDAEASPTVS
jgi:hypothetical protein